MKNKYTNFFIGFVWICTVGVALFYLVTSNISFWLDPARDLLSAWSNLHKLTLIGPPSGIPGFFYGPYWIWWLSVGMIFSKNPSTIIFICITLPYLFIFAGLLLLFSKIYGKILSAFLWVAFVINYLGYLTQLWNPYIAPILFLADIYLLGFYAKKFKGLQYFFFTFLTGFIAGLSLNVHISFSVGFALGCIFYLLLVHRKHIGEALFSVCCFISGIIVTFIPFLLFEVRHGFHQSRIALEAFLHGGGVVSQHGISKPEIIMQFILQLGKLLSIPFPLTLFICILLLFSAVIFYRKRQAYTLEEKHLLLLLGSISISVLGVYLLAKNPIWDYHFIGAEVLWLLCIGLVVSKVKVLKYVLFIWIGIQVILFSTGIIKTIQQNALARGSLYTKEYIVKTIRTDAGRHDYAVYAYSISVYTYEYSYLFKWLTGKDFSFDPHQIPQKSLVYIILPPAWPIFLEDFTNNHTPPSLYTTKKVWRIPDGTIVLKRSLKDSAI